jgi:hypothetical protein
LETIMNLLCRAGAGLCLVACLLTSAGATWDFPGDIRPAHTPVGRNYGWFTDAGDVLLNGAGDKAWVWKDVELDHPVVGTLFIGVDDGLLLWVNGQLALDAQWAAQAVGFWNYAVDLSPYLRHGRNRLAIEVFNVCQGGSGDGGLDFQLEVDGVTVLPGGYWNPLHPANELWYTGGPCSFLPPADARGLDYAHADYGWVDEVVEARETPVAFSLAPAWPNPFNPATTLAFTLTETTELRLAVHDLGGREVALLASGLRERGGHRVVFDAAGLPGGLYFARLEVQGQTTTQKLLLVK